MRFALAAALLLAACSTPARVADLPPPPQLPQRAGVDPVVAARAEGVRFMAHGAAPVFHLRFYDDRVTFSQDGATWQTFPRPEPMHPRWYGEVYETSNDAHRLHIEVRRDRPCVGQGAGQLPVSVRLDGQDAMEGCGRDL